MKVILSGFNLDIETIKELREFVERVAVGLNGRKINRLSPERKKEVIRQLQAEAVRLMERDNLTPETLSAAYARISRNPLPVNELRELSRQEVDRARKSNQNIIFGLGHSSVAEHAVFNFDILGVSRYAVETIEHFRLASYTEKSQRYILFENEFVIPEEIRSTVFEKMVLELLTLQSDAYYRLYDRLKPYFYDLYPEMAADPRQHKTLDGLAKEDARYVISLAVQTQLGMTVNARTLENMISKCNSHPLSEVREYGRQLFDITKKYTPSIVKYVDPSAYLMYKNRDINEFILSTITPPDADMPSLDKEVSLLEYTDNPDDLILATILFRKNNIGFEQAVASVRKLDMDQKKEFYRYIFKNMNPWDGVLREFELVQFTFGLTVSASNYGQLKRHRISNLIVQPYDISLGVTIPPSIQAIGEKNFFMKIIDKTEELYQKVYISFPLIAPYFLTNAHRRRILFKINMRELYHFSRLREDEHAQWDIRNMARKIGHLVKEMFPLSAALLGGKDRFREIYQNWMNSGGKNSSF